jgi:3D (Asp-Asp-Asp) domain-containing protein
MMKEFLYIVAFAIIYGFALIFMMDKMGMMEEPIAIHSISVKDSVQSSPTKTPKVIETKKPVTHTHTDADGDTIPVTITYYQPVAGQCSDNPLITADGSKIDLPKLERGEIKWCAVSPDLYKKGGRIWIDGMGVYEIHDKTSARHRAWVDILISPNHKPKDTKKLHKAIIF